MKINPDIRNIIAVLFCLALIAFILLSFYVKPPPENKEIINYFGGALISSLGTAVGAYFRDRSNDKTG